ncbi:MAG: Clp protease N-terminal domain-containing protein [Acidimicrobiia bacterium]
MFERFDERATRVLKTAFAEAADLGDDAVGTEHLLLALATADSGTARLLAEAGADVAELRRRLAGAPGRRSDVRRDHETLLATLGIDLAEVRRRAEATFGADAVERAAWQVRPPRRRRPLWSRISCSKPLSRRRCESPLAGQPLALIPRVKRLLERATRAARPQLATPGHLLLVLVTGNEPAGEILSAAGVDLAALEAATRRQLDEQARRDQRAS